MTIRDIAVAFGFEVDSQSEKKAEGSIKGLKNLATKLLGSIAVVFSVTKISGFLKDCSEVASNVQEMQNKFDVVFQGMTEEVEEWADSFAKSIGRNKNDIKGYLADNQNMFVGMGMTRDQAAGLSQDLVAAALDLASFNNLQEDQAINAMSKAIMGESESAKTLGAVLNDNTRAMAMQQMGLSGTFQALDEATKMQVNYTAIMMQSHDAIGDCARSLDSYKGRQIQLNSAIAELKEFIGGQLLPVFAIFIGWLTTGVRWLTEFTRKLLTTADGQNRVLMLFDRLHALVKRLQPAIDRMTQTLSRGVSRGIDLVKNIVDKFGGIENVLKVAAIAAGAFMAVLAVSKVMSFIKAAGGLAGIISKVAKAFSLANLKVMAIIAVIVILALIIEDFINFMQGNDSVIGTLFDKAGIGADNAREKILAAWTKVKEFLLGIWDFIKQAAMMWVDTVKGFFERHSESIRKNFERAWGIIKTFLQGVWTFISQLAATLFGSTEDNIDGSTQSTKDKLLEVWGAILEALSAVWDALYEAGSAIFNAIATVIETVFGWIQTFWDNWGSEILSWFKVLWDSIGGILDGFLEIIKGVANFISSVFTGDWQGAWDAIKQIFTGIWDAIVSFITAVWETIKMLFDMALGAIKAVWETVWGAISGFFQGIWNGIVSFFQGIWDWIVNMAQQNLSAIQSVWETVWGAISGFFQGIWNGISSFLSGIWAAITGTISNAINNAYSVIQSVLGAIRDFFSNIFNTISSTVTGIFSNILSAISNTIGNIKDTIVNGINAAVDFIKGLPSQAIQWGKDFIGGLKDGILSGVQGIVDAVKGIGEKIKSFLHFSVPDEGPLTEYESWMPDFMSGLAEGISSNEEVVLDKVRSLAEGISTLTRAATADAATATASTVNNNSSSSVTQNVNIANSYTGGTPEVQKNVSKAMNKSASDATAYMARGLAYARG